MPIPVEIRPIQDPLLNTAVQDCPDNHADALFDDPVGELPMSAADFGNMKIQASPSTEDAPGTLVQDMDGHFADVDFDLYSDAARCTLRTL